MALLVVGYGIGGTAVIGRTLGDFIAIGQHNAVLMEGLAIQQRTLIIGPGTQIGSGGQHAALIAPSGIHADKSAAVNLEQVVGKVKRFANIVLDCNSDEVIIS